MNEDYFTYVQLKDGSVKRVSFSFDLDGYKPLVYGVFDAETDDDLTDQVSESEFDKVYGKICESVAERASDSFDMER